MTVALKVRKTKQNTNQTGTVKSIASDGEW